MEEISKKHKRELKIKAITGDYKFKPSFKNLVKYNTESITKRKLVWGFLPIGEKYECFDFHEKSDYWIVIKQISSKYDVIVTGSVALRIFGVLDRNCADDVDFIATKSTIDKMSDDYNEFSYMTNVYGEVNKVKDLNLVKSFKMGFLKIDMFTRKNVNYIELDGVKIATPFDVMSSKIKMNRKKDITDVMNFLETVERFKNN